MVKIAQEKYRVKLSREKYRMKLSREKNRVKLSREKYRVKLSREKYRVKLSREKNRVKLSREKNRVKLSREKYRVKLSREKYRVKFTQEKYRVKLSREKYRVKLSQEKYRVKLSQEKYRVKLSQEKYIVKLSPEKYRVKFTREKYRVKLSREKYRVKFTQEKYRVKLTQEKYRVKLSQEKQTAIVQLQRLKDELGLSIKSSFEAEFGITDDETKEPLGNHYNNWSSMVVMETAQETLLDLTNAMEEIGVKIDSLQPEYGIGQFEVTFAPVTGIEAADMTAAFKTAAFVYLQTKGFNAEFMTCVNPHVGCCNGFHYNFSLWDDMGKNVFLDPSDPLKLSKLGRHWLAGIVEHSPAMLALSSPTVNCY
ncbi:hypothetical protein RRG08_066962, partial [Elysia crispata]